MEDKIYTVKDSGSEWDYMWLMLGKHPVNKGLNGKPRTEKDPTIAYNDGEAWEYMDTSIYDGEMKHCFRHRFHPKTKNRIHVQVPVSKTFNVEECNCWN